MNDLVIQADLMVIVEIREIFLKRKCSGRARERALRYLRDDDNIDLMPIRQEGEAQ